MKIYCNRREKSIEDFAGVDVWVRIFMRDKNNRIYTPWAKILSISTDMPYCEFLIHTASEEYKNIYL